MRFVCSRSRMAETLQLMGGLISPRSPMRVYQNFLLQSAQDNCLDITAGDMEIMVKYRLQVDLLDKPTDVLVNATDFANLITDLQNRGYGWLRPEGVRKKLNELLQLC